MNSFQPKQALNYKGVYVKLFNAQLKNSTPDETKKKFSLVGTDGGMSFYNVEIVGYVISTQPGIERNSFIGKDLLI